MPPSADVNTCYNRHNQDYQQDQWHDDSYAPWETDRGEMVWRDEKQLNGAETGSDSETLYVAKPDGGFKRGNHKNFFFFPLGLGCLHTPFTEQLFGAWELQ